MIMVALANRNRILVYIFGGQTKNFACLIGERASISSVQWKSAIYLYVSESAVALSM